MCRYEGAAGSKSGDCIRQSDGAQKLPPCKRCWPQHRPGPGLAMFDVPALSETFFSINSTLERDRTMPVLGDTRKKPALVRYLPCMWGTCIFCAASTHKSYRNPRAKRVALPYQLSTWQHVNNAWEKKRRPLRLAREILSQQQDRYNLLEQILHIHACTECVAAAFGSTGITCTRIVLLYSLLSLPNVEATWPFRFRGRLSHLAVAEKNNVMLNIAPFAMDGRSGSAGRAVVLLLQEHGVYMFCICTDDFSRTTEGRNISAYLILQYNGLRRTAGLRHRRIALPSF